MDSQFWIKAWSEGRTAFNQKNYHDKLIEYFPRLNPQAGQRVLVPLCGKSIDMVWLERLKLHVHGVELHAQAVEDFFKENNLSPVQKTEDPDFTNYAHGNFVISCGDFFKLSEKASYDLVYDRAALVALPAPMRKKYAQVIQRCLKPGGKCLIITYEYDQTKMEGPPFSVDTRELQDLYGEAFAIELLESKQEAEEGSRLSAVEGLKQNVYILKKR